MGAPAVDVLEFRIPDFQLQVRLNRHVIRRLGAEGMAGFQAIRRRGLEVGGLLLGRTEPGCVIVEDCLAFASEHLYGPSYLLSEKDKQAFAAAIAQNNAGTEGKRVVGIYRSNTRPELEPASEDIAIMQEYSPGGLFLMLKPEGLRPGTAALFGPGVGMRGKPAEFPLQHGMLQQAHRERAAVAPAAATATAGSATASPATVGSAALTSAKVIEGIAKESQRIPHAPIPVAKPRRRPRIRLTAAALLLLGLGGCFGYSLAHWFTVPLAPTLPTPSPPSQHPIALLATWTGNSLHLQWDRNAPAIRGASSGVLWISDGPQQRRLDLAAKELTEGSIQYWPASADVIFTLDMATPGGTATESVRALSVPLPEAVQASQRSRPEPSHSAARPEARNRVQPAARVDIEIPPQSLLGRAAGKTVPTVPAKPLRTVMPFVSTALAGRIHDPLTVSVRVDIDASGNVRRTELISKRSGSTRSFDNLALNASRKWTFTPASYGRRRVQSRLILNYHFGNPQALLSENR